MKTYQWAASVFAVLALAGVAILAVFTLTHPWGLVMINDHTSWEITLMSLAPDWIHALLLTGLGAAVSVLFVRAAQWNTREQQR
ncbi:MAG: hypothetical protein ABI310_05510 [Microbacteriaceae bacterium]